MPRSFRIEQETLSILRKLFIEQALQQQNELGGVFSFKTTWNRISEEELNSIIIISDDEDDEKDEVDKDDDESNHQHHKRKLKTIPEQKDFKKKKINHRDETLSEIANNDEVVIILTIQKQSLDNEGDEESVIGGSSSSSLKKGRRQLDYTLCEVHDDVPYTFHCHPIEIDSKTKLPINMANLISSEDMIGVVQDHASNTGYLSNCQGKLQFDILLCPLGIFVYSATNSIIEKWINMEEELPYNQKNRKLMKLLDPSADCSNNDKFEKQLKHLIHTTLNEDNPFWATEENALMNEGFNEYIGSWYYLNNNRGVFATEIIPKFKYLGYQFWWKDEVDNLNSKSKPKRKSNKIQDVSNDEEIQAKLAEDVKLPKQLEWFKSDEFLSIDYKNHSLVKEYIQDMRNLGFFVEFFNWNSSLVEFNYPND